MSKAKYSSVSDVHFLVLKAAINRMSAVLDFDVINGRFLTSFATWFNHIHKRI